MLSLLILKTVYTEVQMYDVIDKHQSDISLNRYIFTNIPNWALLPFVLLT